ncbi:MAG: hypothetical protein ABR909_10485 [Candidatus Bathyarchaeia archaeon]
MKEKFSEKSYLQDKKNYCWRLKLRDLLKNHKLDIVVQSYTDCGTSAMIQAGKWSKYTLDVFLEEASRSVNNGGRVYCNILIAYPQVFDKIPRRLEIYGLRKNRPWTVELTRCEEEGLFVVNFRHKQTEKTVPFLWKVIRDEKYVTILSFSLDKHSEIRKSLYSLVGVTKGLWLAWLGSDFLERLDDFAKKYLSEDAEVFASLASETIEGKNRPRKIRSYPMPRRKYIPLAELRESNKENYEKTGDITKYSTMRYRISSEEKKISFTISVTDRAKVMFEKGDFTVFASLLKPMVTEARKILDVLRREHRTTEEETKMFGKVVCVSSPGVIQTLVYRKPENAKKWFKEIVELFGVDNKDQKLVNFTLLSGNPYFLSHVIDVENGSSIYLSATSDDLRIAPAENYPNESTVAKVIDILQRQIDPSISFS